MASPPKERGNQADPLEDLLYDAEMRRVYRYICYHVDTREEADDLTADVFQLSRRWKSRRRRGPVPGKHRAPALVVVPDPPQRRPR